MARKFLYLIALIVVVVFAARLVVSFGGSTVSRLALVPGDSFKPQPAVAADRYDDPAMWFSRPGLPNDPARFVPKAMTSDAAPLSAAVFFIHPTSYLNRAAWNAPLDDETAVAFARRMLSGMASAFNASPDLWAPKYRQATFGAFLSDGPDARAALDLAYGDVAQAFAAFLRANLQAPIVLVGHSQGAYHLKRLLKEQVAGTPLATRVVAAYVIGWPVSTDHDLPGMGLPACARPDQSGCVMSWLSYAEPADTSETLGAYARFPALDGKSPGSSPFLCSNPLTGGIGGSAGVDANLGTLKPDAEGSGATLLPKQVPARCGIDGVLLIGQPPEMGEYVLPGNNYHVYDIPLFWANVRADVARRAATWGAQVKETQTPAAKRSPKAGR